ncbi:peptidase [Bifidobacterium aemilianum]|uniref:Peptidase n=2 Tax=Bifidobacterium aemilianum TaxID=2493120 RepID=A0A366K810_9BIFI|nr:alpha/beta fold hydrolase [Bifidobacterium aemilianum]RBP97804.1 peptidase [Bifidobacterium aemilianum]
MQAIEDFPARKARTLRFSCGAPRSARLIGDGRRALFLRSRGSEDLVTALWMSLVNGPGADGEPAHQELLLADPRELLADADEERLPDEERARRERAREGGQGIVSYSVDEAGRKIVFTINGQLFLTTIDPDGQGSNTRQLATDSLGADGSPWLPVINPEISPDGRMVAYTTGRRLVMVRIDDREGLDADNAERLAYHDRVCGLADVSDRADWLPGAGSGASDSDETWKLGLAEFIAGEEMDRYAGFWWSPDSRALLFEVFDSSPEPVWYISDPANPDRPAASRRYAQALRANARVYLAEVRLAFDTQGAYVSRETFPIDWDSEGYEYLAAVSWTGGHRPIILVQNRTQSKDQVLEILESGHTRLLEAHVNDHWLDLLPGTPALTPDGRLICAFNDLEADSNRLTCDGRPCTPAGWQVRSLLDVADDSLLVTASKDPKTIDLLEIPLGCPGQGEETQVRVLNPSPGIWTGSRVGGQLLMTGRTMESPAPIMTHLGHSIASMAAEPGFSPQTRFVELGAHRLQTAITYPSAQSPYAQAERLPVLLKPYGGPGHQEVMLSQSHYWDSQWWADQGFLVVTADGRGTTGRGPAWDRAIHKEMKAVTLADQVEAVQALAEAEPKADTGRVAMIGWSYGGFLSALAVLEAPDVIHAACAGAPPTDWSLYDTHYTERYLGLDPQTYERNSIIRDAPALRRPLLLIHGFADDNVSIANSLRLSQALMAAGRPHSFLPLTGITHMTNDETVARNLLIMQRDFLYQALGMEAGGAQSPARAESDCAAGRRPLVEGRGSRHQGALRVS